MIYKKVSMCVSVCVCVWFISGETANVSAPWLISFNYSGWTKRAHQRSADSSIWVPSLLITNQSGIIHLPFTECDILPSTKASYISHNSHIVN